MKQYSVAIIGCGSIGALKNNIYDSPMTDAVLTHAHAFYLHPDTKIIAFIDPDIEKGVRSMEKWQAPHYRTCMEVVITENEIHPDIVVVATPTETHHDILMQVLELRPTLVVAEKPFCSTLKEACEVHDAYALAQIPIVINYTRRFDPIAADVFADLRDGKYGQIYHARCLYGRGLRRDGCHGLDVFNLVFGQPCGLSFNHDGIIDHLSFDPSYTLRLEYNGCREVYMVGTDSRAWGAFELDFITEKGVLRFTDWGKTFQHFGAECEATYGQYHALAPSAEKVNTGLMKALLYMVDNCVQYFRDQENKKLKQAVCDGFDVPQAIVAPDAKLLCTAADAIRVHEILSEVKA